MNNNARFKVVRRMVLASAFLIPVLAFAAEDPATMTLGTKNTKGTHAVKVGGTIAVRLAAQLGTGYRWHLAPSDAAVLAQAGEPKTEPAATAKPVVGGFETQVFRFTAKAPGKVDLKFQYLREFEPSKKPLRTATFHIKVVEAKK